MQVILLEKVDKLGALGDTVTVKPGYARNYLLPQGKALRVTQDNLAFFDAQRKSIEADNAKKRETAEKESKVIADKDVTIVRAASESGKLYGSVSARDIAEAVSTLGSKVTRQQIRLLDAIKNLGLFDIDVVLHPEVVVKVTVNVARSEEEAKLQLEKGGALVSDGQNHASAEPETLIIEESSDEEELSDKAVRRAERKAEKAAKADDSDEDAEEGASEESAAE